MSSKWVLLRLCVLQLFVMFLVESTECRQFRCDYKYSKETSGWMKLHRVPDTWHRARLRCHLEGANLASPTPELIDTMKFMMSNVSNKMSTTGIYTGIHASISAGDYYSIEGKPLIKIPHTWAQGEPDNKQNLEHCIAMLSDGTLADVNCNNSHPYICYKKGSAIVLTACGTVDPEYTLESRTGSCYKFHGDARSWSDAYMACSSEGGYLAIINSEAEAQIIREILGKHPTSKLRSGFDKSYIFMGFHNWNDKGEWLTVHGQTLEEAGYDKFQSGEPSSPSAEFCGAVSWSVQMHDRDCLNKYVFICEKSVDSLLCDED